MGRTRYLAAFAGLVASLPGAVAHACLVCETGTGEQVRAGVWDHDFGFNLLATLLPFPVLGAIVAMIYFGVPFRRRTAVLRPSRNAVERVTND
jgi:hypothetical protein